MLLSALNNRNIGILGFGREGRAVFDALRRAGHAGPIHVFLDVAMEPIPEGVVLHIGSESETALEGIDLLVRSPGFKPSHPLRQAADARDIAQTTSTNLFLEELRTAGLPVIGITGSKGKSTTATLAFLTLQQAGIPAALVGNIGQAALDQLDEILEKKLTTVLELSSYQCADLVDGFGPSIAGLLDLFPEHLDWHGSVEAYYAAKLRIAQSQRADDLFFYNQRSAEVVHHIQPPGRVAAMNIAEGLHFQDGWFFRGTEKLFPDTDIKLPGVHNRENAVAALALTESLGAKPEHLQAVLAAFTGLPYRLQDEGVHAGIRWINDSLSTAPEAAAAALQAFNADAATLIAGGYDRGYDSTPLIDALKRSAVRTLITIPDTGANIAAKARTEKWDGEIIETASLEEAVAAARTTTPSGRTCVFSPGAPSYNRYKSFEERGTHFRSLLTD